MEDITHDNDVHDIFAHILLHSDFNLMQSKELNDQGVSVLLQVIVVVRKNRFQVMEFRSTHCFKRELTIGGVVKERATLACARQLTETIEPTFDHAEQLIRTNAFQVLLV